MAERTRVAKSLLRLDALARGGGAGGLEGGMSVHRSALCPGWETLAADGALAVPLDNNAVARPRGAQLLRVNHYQYRSLDYMVRVKSCRSLGLTSGPGRAGRAGGTLHALEV